MARLKKNIFICGRYGSGKSTIALNLAFLLGDSGVGVSLVDLDLINPYFRSSDMSHELCYYGITMLSPKATDIKINNEEMLPKVSALIEDENTYTILDVGNDDDGSTLMRNLSSTMGEVDYDLLYVVNFTKSATCTPESAAADIEQYCKSIGLCCTGIINNSHIANLTNHTDVTDSVESAKILSEQTGLPVLYHCFDKNLDIKNAESALPLEIYVAPSWYHKKII